jgi:mono/diheme cytochrome c family protein
MPPSSVLLGSLLLALPLWGAAVTAAPAVAPTPTYEKQVLPLFRARCSGCHGGAHPDAGFVVATRGEMVQGGRSGPSVVPGSPEKSLLYQILASGQMPKGGGKLAPAELKLVERWIRAGAPGTTGAGGHWAFQPVTQPAVPPIRNPQAAIRNGTVRNPIDRFVLADLERRGLTYAPEADRRTLLRRVTFDLIGLPPTPEEVDAFLSDRRPDAYERVVDRLLADPRYGERWARHWLDAAGYADSEGVLQEDRIRPNAWRYRDYVIRAFNSDKPYDLFLKEQLAGDEMVDWRRAATFTPEMIETLTATGFLRTAVDATRDDFNPHQYGEYQYRMLHDTQTIVASSVLGLTVQCSRCHDHKYEPISQRDYYRIQALFTGAVRPRGAILPTSRRQIVAGSAEEQKHAAEVNAAVDREVAALNEKDAGMVREYQLRALEGKLESVPEADRAPLREAAALPEGKRSEPQKALTAKYASVLPGPEELASTFPALAAAREKVRRARETESRKRIVLPEIRAFYDLDASPPPTPLLARGDWLKPADPVEPGIPAILDREGFRVPPPAAGSATTGRRRALAEWVTRPDNPLTARVVVNRVWAHHFGEGIVATVENFGRSGARPANRALLDWLAGGFAGRWASGVGRQEADPTDRSDQPHPTDLAEAGLRPWSLKSLHRLIVTSAAYRQSSAVRNPQSVPTDARMGAIRNPQFPVPGSYCRPGPRRLEAEAVRDAILAVSGSLDPTMFGEAVGNEVRGTGEIVGAGEEGKGRRSIYLLVRRSMPVTLLNTFDAPVMETNCPRRTASTTATQALALMNGSFIAAQAGHFADRLLRERPPSGDGDARTVEWGYRLAFARPPTPAERAATLDFLRTQAARYSKAGQSPEAARRLAHADFCQALLSANEFVYLD